MVLQTHAIHVFACNRKLLNRIAWQCTYAAPAMTCYPLFNSWRGEAVPYSFPHQSQKARTSFGDLRFDLNRPSYISIVWFTRRHFATAHLVLGWERLKHSGHNYYCINTSKLSYKVVIVVCIHITFAQHSYFQIQKRYSVYLTTAYIIIHFHFHFDKIWLS